MDKIKELNQLGFTIIADIYTSAEVEKIINSIENTNASKDIFGKTTALFAIRQCLKAIPDSVDVIFNTKLMAVISRFFGEDFFVVKSMYFDKPAASNWFVAYHQDLTISVHKKIDTPEYGPWTVKQNQFAVQAPIYLLEKNFTIRIHLDDAHEHNGALKVVPTSHQKKIYRPETIDWATETETTCVVKKGGIMLMKPLLLHSSGKSMTKDKRRVIHIEFSNQALPNGLQWTEKMELKTSRKCIL
jgi:ectoine hydroxylase-related dioxygenase (phytanoyl-CoA dioxygenase family)